MTDKKRLLITLVVLMVASLYLFLEREEVYEASMDQELMVVKDIKAPDFTLKDIEGVEVSLKDYKDRIVFLNFWVSWQDKSVEEIEALKKLAEKNPDIEVLLVNVREDREIVQKFLKSRDIDLRVLLDQTGEIGIDYVIGELPNTYIIDQEGNIRENIVGSIGYDKLEETLNIIKNKK